MVKVDYEALENLDVEEMGFYTEDYHIGFDLSPLEFADEMGWLGYNCRVYGSDYYSDMKYLGSVLGVKGYDAEEWYPTREDILEGFEKLPHLIVKSY